ncbi:Exo-beta-D-glucosaminidase [Arenibacter antarcticus]|uniref:Glycoside hydrolase family 2 TIM barrel-domain containing protein n=1 Tax=Arenibacter antarcticus TaxID=2040469 RepID=A0ABW5VAR7_9FLAO|nr:glycoside hydrolase family 2 TIM barrel-domain containing protein [Arenibacter sp. H213]MCM4167433.1 glycoside hydrolase family 2 [Arenibacter sp. H213]
MHNSVKIALSDNWRIQSSNKVSEKGGEISTESSISNNWLTAKVPSTVLSTLVANKVYENPYFGENLKSIPTELFKVPWWYATNFELTQEQANNFARLNFDGINYKANVWLNGHLIANTKAIDGAFRITAFNVSDYLIRGTNVLAIEVIPPKPGDFSTGFVDWNPAPPDGNMGVFRPVTLHLHGGVHIEKPFVQTKVNLETLKEAHLTVSTELINYSDTVISGDLIGTIGTILFKKKISLAPKDKELVIFTSTAFSELHFKEPKLWWPIHLGNPDLYDLDLKFVASDEVLDETQLRFGIREIEDYWLDDIHRGYKVNGKKVLIKGGGWTDDMLLMDTDESIEAQVKYVKQMNLNCIRLEGFWGKDHKLYDLCDQHGILLMVGWSCHWEHEIHMGVPVNERFGGVYKPKDIAHIAQAWEDQVIWLRNHPSIFVWTVASDKVPITELEQKYIDTFAKYDPTRPYLNSTGGVGSDQHVIGSEDVISEISGSSGVKMLGPYAYTAPVYWFTDTKLGGAYGFNTETGPGAQVPQLESLKRMIPKEQLWPIGEAWNYHCGRYEFADLSRFTKAIEERYGTPSSLEEFDKKAQAMNYELMRPMFEAFQVYKKRSTGVIQWMLNAAWPKMYWQLYDYYLNPTAAFYATQKACKPLSLIYNYGDKHIYAVNDHTYRVENLEAQIRVFSINSEILLDEKVAINLEPDSSKSILALKELKGLTTTYFIDLRLINKDGVEINNNFYWLSTKEEVLDYGADLGDFAFHTPSKEYADLTELNHLPKVHLEETHHFEQEGETQKIEVQLKNNNNYIAFLINLKLVDKVTDNLILPIFWEDNFLTLLPGEERTISATYSFKGEAQLKVEGWNLL